MSYSDHSLSRLDLVGRFETGSGYAENGSIRIRYRTFGAGPAILLQHGFPDTDLTFAAQVAELARDHLVITPTLRGYPPSSVPSDPGAYVLTELAEDIAAVLDHLGIGQATVGGHDWGGGVAQAFTLAHPERVTGMILMNSPISMPFRRLVNHDAAQQELSKYTIPFIEYEQGDPKDVSSVTHAIRDDAWRASVDAYIAESPLHGMLNYYRVNYPGPPYGAPQPENLTPYVYHVPSLVIWGVEDEFFSLKILNDLPLWFAEPLRLVTVPRAGHWVFQDQPDLVNSEIRSWLARPRPDSISN